MCPPLPSKLGVEDRNFRLICQLSKLIVLGIHCKWAEILGRKSVICSYIYPKENCTKINHIISRITWISGSATTNCFNIRLPKARDIANTPPTLQVPKNTIQQIKFSYLRLSFFVIILDNSILSRQKNVQFQIIMVMLIHWPKKNH